MKNLNKNVSVWRGNNLPPTNCHLWILDDGSIDIYLEDTWINIIPSDLNLKYKELFKKSSEILNNLNATLEEYYKQINNRFEALLGLSLKELETLYEISSILENNPDIVKALKEYTKSLIGNLKLSWDNLNLKLSNSDNTTIATLKFNVLDLDTDIEEYGLVKSTYISSKADKLDVEKKFNQLYNSINAIDTTLLIELDHNSGVLKAISSLGTKILSQDSRINPESGKIEIVFEF